MPWDALLQQTLLEEVARRRPRVLFVGYGETDEWAHNGRYDLVLQTAHAVDGFIRELWNTMQAMPEYRDKTTFLVTTDHGRGSGPENWKHHDWNVDGAEKHLDRGDRPGHAGARRAPQRADGHAEPDRGDGRGAARQGLAIAEPGGGPAHPRDPRTAGPLTPA
jgi:hypothetical protein